MSGAKEARLFGKQTDRRREFCVGICKLVETSSGCHGIAPGDEPLPAAVTPWSPWISFWHESFYFSLLYSFDICSFVRLGWLFPVKSGGHFAKRMKLF